MTTTDQQSGSDEKRYRYRPPSGIPIKRDSTVAGAVTSIFLHLLLIVFILYSTRVPEVEILFPEYSQTPGDAGPAGGGGGGTRGSGGVPAAQERIQYAQFNPPPPTPTLTPDPVEIVPPEVKPDPVVVTPPVVEPPPILVVPPPVVATTVAAKAVLGSIDSLLRGRGGGTGNDGTSGSGPGTGGGVGPGNGTGRGPGDGPGSGGTGGNVYAASPRHTPLIPEPPNRLRPYTLIAEFDVDSTGKVVRFKFNETPDRGYNRKIEEMLSELRFNPAQDLVGRRLNSSIKLTFTYY